jgi:hypothetical protein
MVIVDEDEDEDREAQRYEQHRHDGAQFRGGKRRVEKCVSPSSTRSGPAHGVWSLSAPSSPVIASCPALPPMFPRGSIGKSHGLCHRLRTPSLALLGTVRTGCVMREG